MKNILILMLSVIAVFGLNAQSMAEANVNQMAATSGDEPMTLSQYFKKNVMDWNVGNLHVFPEDQNNTEKAYYYEGEMMEKKYYRLLPYQLQNKVIKGSKFYSVNAIRGNDLKYDPKNRQLDQRFGWRQFARYRSKENRHGRRR